MEDSTPTRQPAAAGRSNGPEIGVDFLARLQPLDAKIYATGMSSDRWQQVKALYSAACERSPEERAAFLREACGDNADLRREVERLLAQPVSDGFLSTPAGAEARDGRGPGQTLSGKRFGTYQVHELLGAGGMGEVYRAHDSRLGRDVAVKILPAAFTSDGSRLARFEREARVLAALNHPHIAAIYGVEDSPAEDGAPVRALVLELVEGETLADRIAFGPLPVKEALQIARQIAAALETAHEKGIVHRDLKPANVKITPDGTVKVLDFGLAKPQGPGSSDDLAASPTLTGVATAHGVILGTVAYMSPEQARGQGTDRRTDIWAFGCVLYEMLAGRPVFAAPTTADTLAAVLEGQLDWTALPRDTPPAVVRVLRRCLQRDPRQRLRDIADARLELEDAAADAEVVTHTRQAGKRLRTGAAMGLLVVGLMVGALAASLTLAPSAQPALSARFVVTLPSATPLAGLDFPAAVISPDGTRIVYVASRGGQTQLFQRSLNSIEPVPIAGTTNATGPFFSPDSQWVAFFADGQLKKVSLAGGAPVTLCAAPVGLGGSWGPNDIIAFAAATGSGLSQVHATGGTPGRLTTLDLAQSEFSHRWPEWLPDGDTVLFTVGTSGSWSDAQIMAHTVSSGKRTMLVRGGTDPHYLSDGSLVYAQNGRIMRVALDASSLTVSGTPVAVVEHVRQSADGIAQFSVSRSGTAVFIPGGPDQTVRRLVSVNRDGTSTPFAASAGSFAFPRASPDGRRLIVAMEAPSRDLWLYDVTSGTTEQFTFDAGATSPVWARDGQLLAFSSTRVGVLNLFSARIGEPGRSERLAASGNQQFPGSWAPDGTLAFTERRPETGRDILLLAAGDRTPRPLLTSRADETSPKISPDGRLLAYVSTESGRSEVYVTPLSTPPRSRQISADGGSEPAWAAAERELFYRQGTTMMAVTLDAGGQVQSGPRPLFDGDYVRGTSDTANYDVMPDGRFVMVQRPSESSEPTLHVLINWLGTLSATSPR